MGKELIKSRALKDVLASPDIKSRLQEIMGQRAPQFAAALVQIQAQSWQLQNCDPHSIVGAAIKAVALDLSIDPQLGEAHLVPYGGKCTFQLGYIGLGQLAQRSGQYRRLGWVVVHDGELIHYDELAGDLELDSSKRKSDTVIGYAAKFSLLNGFERAEYWTVERVMAHAERYSQAYRAGLRDEKKRDTMWFTDPDRAGLKTVFKSLVRVWGPKSVQMRQALMADEAAIDLTGEVQTYPDNPKDGGEPKKPVFDTPPPTALPPATPAAETKPSPTPPTPVPEGATVNLFKLIRGQARLKNVTEEQLLAALAELNVTEGNERKLEDLQPGTLAMLNDQINDICARITGIKGGEQDNLSDDRTLL